MRGACVGGNKQVIGLFCKKRFQKLSESNSNVFERQPLTKTLDKFKSAYKNKNILIAFDLCITDHRKHFIHSKNLTSLAQTLVYLHVQFMEAI